MIRLFTDSGCNLPGYLLQKYQIGIIPLTLNVNGKDENMAVPEDFDGKSFYDAMRNGATVHTSLPSTEAFRQEFLPVLKEGHDVLYVGLSSGISGTANSARLAAEELREEYPDQKIATIDTVAASLAEGLQVLDAADKIRQGMPFDLIVERLNNRKKSYCQFFTVDDLMYLKKGGRISGAAALVGNILSIKPLLTGNDLGQIELCGKVRGMRQALRSLADRYAALCEDKTSPIGIAHADAPDNANLLLSMLREKGFTGECFKVIYEPITGSHVGPGTVALFYKGIRKNM